LGIGLAYAGLTWLLLARRDPSVQGADFTYPWLAARALLHGESPYAVPTSALPFGGRIYYPITAAAVALPFAALPAWLGAVLVVGLTMGLAAFVVTRDHEWWRLLMFASGPAVLDAYSVQWGALFTFALMTPWAIGIVGSIKPHMALALAGGQRSWRALIAPIVVGLLLVLLSLVLEPGWPREWLRTLHDSPLATVFQSPLLTAWGLPIWLALVRWRDPNARLLFLLALAPQANFFYDQLPLLTVARNRREMLAYVVCTLGVLVWPLYFAVDRTNVITLSHAYGPLVMLGGYYPALILVLRHRVAGHRVPTGNSSPDGGPAPAPESAGTLPGSDLVSN
jgi:hypothetical protein